MRSVRMFVTSTATAALALALAACGGSDAPSGDKEPAKARNKARFRNDLGGDEAADSGKGIYLIRKGDKLITVQGVLSGLSTTDLEKVVREAAAIL